MSFFVNSRSFCHSFCGCVVRIYENVRENFFPLSDVSLMIWWIGFPFLHLTYCCQMHYGPCFSSKLCKDYNVFEMLVYLHFLDFFPNQKSWFSNILTMDPVCLSPLRSRSDGPSKSILSFAPFQTWGWTWTNL